jgi:hypothetical protein
VKGWFSFFGGGFSIYVKRYWIRKIEIIIKKHNIILLYKGKKNFDFAPNNGFLVVSQFDFLNHTMRAGRASPKVLPDAYALASMSAHGTQAGRNID